MYVGAGFPLQPDGDAVKFVDPAVPDAGLTDTLPPDGGVAGCVYVTEPLPEVSVILSAAVADAVDVSVTPVPP